MHDTSEFCFMVVPLPQWLQKVQASYTADTNAQGLIAKLSLDGSVVPNFTLKDGLLRYKNRIWIGKDPDLHSQLIAALHCSSIGGHSGIPVTYCRLK
jgi:hypothetical protein